jgi:predicted nucleic acid-binding protein
MSTQYWDAGVFCSFFNARFEPARASIVRALLEDAEAGRIVIVTSTVSLAEVLKVDREHPLTKASEDKIVAFFEKPYIRLVSADRLICEAARQLIWRHSALEYKDAIHLASAIQYSRRASLDALFAWDEDFTKLNGKIGAAFPISEPFIEQPSLESWANRPVPEAPAAPTGEASPP